MNIEAGGDSRGAECRAHIQAKAWKNVVKAVLTLHAELQKVVSVSNPRPHVTPSAPGEPPRLRTGLGRSSIVYELDEPHLSARIGVLPLGKHMAFHELARRVDRRRPWLLVTVERLWQRLRAIAGGG